MLIRENLANAKRIVVKVGTSTLTYTDGKLNIERIEKLVQELADIAKDGKEIILVTSGAVSVGVEKLGLKERPKTIPEKQAAAAVGQGILMHIYEKLFDEYEQIVAQVLLTKADSVSSKGYINSRNALLTLLNQKVIPIINENDVISIDELKIGDNDTLSAIVASIVDAQVLVILTDVQGLYDKNPADDTEFDKATLISKVDDITLDIEMLAGSNRDTRGTGGMYTKIQAAKIAVNSGVTMVIASGGNPGNIKEVLLGKEIGTVFAPKKNLTDRKKRLIYESKTEGKIIVDKGCEKAIVHSGSSLLAKGITGVEGAFEQGDVIKIISQEGRELARGICNYNSDDVDRIKGVHTDEIANIIGTKQYNEVIHRDNLVLIV
ncbi:glutamate 5-kinase [Selenomonadales bacterium OttesenSCG-928-I06]|nr:glutamate 5-kinase [Selenomonadales bacterium OttesenSCG-928-I06]